VLCRRILNADIIARCCNTHAIVVSGVENAILPLPYIYNAPSRRCEVVCGCQFGCRGTCSVLVAPTVKMSCRIRYGVFNVVDANALKMDASIFLEDSDSHLY